MLIRAQDGFRKRAVRLNGRLVAIRSARAIPQIKPSTARSYALTNAIAPADFTYYRLTDADDLVVPFDLVPRLGTTFLDVATSRYHPYRNTFAALRELPVPVQQAPAPASRGDAACIAMAQ